MEGVKNQLLILFLASSGLAACKTSERGSSLAGDETVQACAPLEATVPPSWPRVEGSLTAWLEARPHAGPKSEARILLQDGRLEGLQTALAQLWSGRWDEGRSTARDAGYEATLFTQNGASFILLAAAQAGGIDATVVLNLAPRADLVVEVPHPDFEPGTTAEGTDLLLRAGGRALIQAGAHRCASTRASPCGGKTAVCTTDGVAIPYADSDAGHNAGNAFDVFHRALAERWQKAKFVQLHGMREGETWVILSDGGKANRPGRPAWPEAVRDALRPVLGADVKAVSCQDPDDGARFNHRRLCGTDNTQGRFVNLSPDACGTVAPAATGRFLHIEQTFDVLQGERPGGAVVDAVISTLPGC